MPYIRRHRPKRLRLPRSWRKWLRLPRLWRKWPLAFRVASLLLVFLITFVGGLVYASWTLVCRPGQCPSIAVLDDWRPRQTSKVFAADGRFIAEIGLERRTLVKLGEIPSAVRSAFVMTEDKRFYDHLGIDWIRVFGAGWRNLQAGGYAQGFSTITMQLARNVFPERISREKTLSRKLKEIKVARAIEAKYPKQKILELYLNQIYLGNGAYGVETASQRYFGKSVRDLNLAEAATLAALPKAPERYNPRRQPEQAIQRRNTIIELMRRQGAVTDADARLAKAYPLRLARKEDAGDLAPYFVEWVRRQLDEQFGQRLYRDGLRIYTTLDVELQLAAERALERQLKAIESGKYGEYVHTTYEEYLARNATGDVDIGPNTPYLQGAFAAIDPRSGAVLALVGGRDHENSKFNRATQALRQPGSTFKPLVYADAIRRGYPASYILEDTALVLPQPDSTVWAPQNYDLKFEPPMTMRRALYLSRNLPSIRMGMELGERSVIGMARKFGITTRIPAVPSIHLGAADVYPLELIAAYTAFPTLGVRAAPYAIARVETARGDVLWEATPLHYEVLARDEAWLMLDMMRDVIQRGSAYSAVWGAGFRLPAAGKTGTTNDGADVWFVGFTPDLVAGVWMGFDRPRKIQANAQGGRLAAPAWTTFMTEVYEHRPIPEDWKRPELIIAREIDRNNGLLRNLFCPLDSVTTEFYIPGTEPLSECDLHSPFTAAAADDSLAPRGSPWSIAAPGARAPARPRSEPHETPRRGRRDNRHPDRRDTSGVLPDPFKLPL